MVNFRMLCERYISIDDELTKLREKIDNANYCEINGLMSEYLLMYMEAEDFKSGMRRYLVGELVKGKCE